MSPSWWGPRTSASPACVPPQPRENRKRTLSHRKEVSLQGLTTGRGGGGGRLQRDGRGPPPPFTSMQSSLAVLGDRVAKLGCSQLRAGAKLQPPLSSPRTLSPTWEHGPPARNCGGGCEVHKNITSSSLSPSPAARGWLGAVGPCRIRPRCSCREYIQLGRFCLGGVAAQHPGSAWGFPSEGPPPRPP